MTAIQLLACAGMIVGAFLILGLKPVEFTDSLFAFLLWKKSSIREDIRASTGRKKAGPLKREIMEAQAKQTFFSGLCRFPGVVLYRRFHRYPAGQFFHGSGSGGGVYVPALLVCEADCQPL